MEQPILHTERLLLRPFRLTDASTVQKLAGDRAIADTTLSIPHPYENGVAEAWIRTHPKHLAENASLTYAITRKNETSVIGAIGLALHPDHALAEMGYWIGKSYWGQGYCTDAAKQMVQHGFETLQLNRIFARHLSRNPASGRVMVKVGMKFEGCLRQHVRKWGVFEDLNIYAILKETYQNQ
jgi:RimJ/RimL family protein N-acetyltransferase